MLSDGGKGYVEDKKKNFKASMRMKKQLEHNDQQ
jgi:hypothetical protein